MFGFSWAEIGLIMAVALIAMGEGFACGDPDRHRDDEEGARHGGRVPGPCRRDDARCELSDVKQEIDKRRFDFKSAAENAIDPDGALRNSVARPLNMPSMAAAPVAAAAAAGSEPAAELASVYEMGEGAGPSFVPPPVVAEVTAEAPAFIPPDAARKPPVPDFIPPGTKRWGY